MRYTPFRAKFLKTVISGGQTGADLGGLMAGDALEHFGVKTSGWCPKGWKNELGKDTRLWNLGLREHPSSDYEPRTEANVQISTGTVLFGDITSPGSKLTLKMIEKHRVAKFIIPWRGETVPYMINMYGDKFLEWLNTERIKVLNVAGNRESVNPGIQGFVANFIFMAICGMPERIPVLLNKHTCHPLTAKGAIYIGRPSKWGNPFTHIKDRDTLAQFVVPKDEVIPRYEEYFMSNEQLKHDAKVELKGMDLLCFCSPNRCHGDILLRYANSK